MLSLKEEIAQFLKAVSEEDWTLPKSERHSSTQRGSNRSQNDPIFTQFARMASVFRNYCKLNDKVYGRIIQYELEVHDQHAKLNTLVRSLQRRMDQSLKMIKTLHQETRFENQRNSESINLGFAEIKKEVDEKTDDETVMRQVKSMLKQYDEGVLNFAELQQDNNFLLTRNDAKKLNDSFAGKKGKVSYEDLQQLNTGIDTKFHTNSRKIGEILQEIQYSQYQLKDQTLKSQKNTDSLKKAYEQIQLLEEQQTKQKQSYNQQLDNLRQYIEEKISQNVWKVKFQQYHKKLLNQKIEPLENLIHEHGKRLDEDYNARLKHQAILQQIQKEIFTKTLKLEDLENQHNITNQKIKQIDMNLSLKIEDHKLTSTILQRQITLLKQNFSNQMNQLQNRYNQLYMQIQLSQPQTSHSKREKFATLQSLSHLQMDLSETRQNVRQTNSKIFLIHQQIRHIKEVLSCKANYTDVILQVQRKADKLDFHELKQLMEQPTHFPTAETMKFSKCQRMDSLKRVQSAGKSVNLFSTVQPSPKDRPDKSDKSNKIFNCGIQISLQNSKKLLPRQSRIKILKSAHSSLFADDK